MLGISVFPDVNARRLCGIFDEFAVFFQRRVTYNLWHLGFFFMKKG